jgi:2-keto-4-pentenoate hydratase/2-oxohepta-3-ene-1,7-dioic acid hydratase in catechol pathway
MKIVSWTGGVGRLEGDVIVAFPNGWTDVFGDGAGDIEGARLPLADVTLTAPIPSPSKIIAIGLNYADHAAETGTPVPEVPALFGMFENSVVGPGEPIRVPVQTEQPDYEAELGVVIGRTTKGVAVEDALDHVLGYVCVNDVSARDLQGATTQWFQGKSIDTFLPIGPWVVTRDEVPDPQSLSIELRLNGEVRQSSNTDQMIWSVADLVAYISATMTLNPGDVIITGTPPGVGLAMDPHGFLHDGDTVEVTIEGLGTLSNPVVR